MAAADSLHIPADWQKVSEKVEPPRMMCLGGVSCPSLSRSYETSNIEDSKSELEMTIPDSARGIKYDGPCGRNPDDINKSTVNLECSVRFDIEDRYFGEVYLNHARDLDVGMRVFVYFGERHES